MNRLKYIYHIMSFFNVPWMNVILEKVYKNEMKSLVELVSHNEIPHELVGKYFE